MEKLEAYYVRLPLAVQGLLAGLTIMAVSASCRKSAPFIFFNFNRALSPGMESHDQQATRAPETMLFYGSPGTGLGLRMHPVSLSASYPDLIWALLFLIIFNSQVLADWRFKLPWMPLGDAIIRLTGWCA
jgi:hypothetical protein